MLTEQEFSARYCGAGKTRAPDHVGRRVLVDGTFSAEDGNTIIRHVTKGSRSMAVLTDIQEALATCAFGHDFAYLPTDSFHMTVFEGVIDSGREDNHWPEGIDFSAPIEVVTQIYLERFKSFANPGPFRMRVRDVTPNGLVMEGAPSDDEKKAREWRNCLSDLLGYTKPNHDNYVFHVTLAYQLKWLPPEAPALYLDLLERLLQVITAETPILELNPTAFCKFKTITNFEELKVL